MNNILGRTRRIPLRSFATRGVAAILSVCIVGLTAPPALASSLLDHWEARPLIDTQAATQANHPAQKPVNTATPDQTSSSSAASGPSLAEIEQRLKPAEPFLNDVEKRLQLKPPANSTLLSRLNTLQLILYGEQKFQDGGELLAELAKLFPEEAAQAHAQLMAEMKKHAPPAAHTPQVSSTMDAYPPQSTQQPSGTSPLGSFYPPPGAASAAASTDLHKSKKHRARPPKNDGWYDFDNDPFFRDNSMEEAPQYAPEGGAGGRLRSLGQGLGALAMVAGSLAGTYFLNRQMGNTGLGNMIQDPYAMQNGYPYGYGHAPYGYNPYGYNVLPNTVNPYGYYGAPATVYQPGGRVIQQPYSQNAFPQYMPGGLLPRF